MIADVELDRPSVAVLALVLQSLLRWGSVGLPSSLDVLWRHITQIVDEIVARRLTQVKI